MIQVRTNPQLVTVNGGSRSSTINVFRVRYFTVSCLAPILTISGEYPSQREDGSTNYQMPKQFGSSQSSVRQVNDCVVSPTTNAPHYCSVRKVLKLGYLLYHPRSTRNRLGVLLESLSMRHRSFRGLVSFMFLRLSLIYLIRVSSHHSHSSGIDE
jgi:hypothetical protein